MIKRALPKYVYSRVNNRNGKTYYHFEKGGVRALVDPTDAGFWRTYAELLEAKPLPLSRNFAALIKSYRASDGHAKLSPRTKADYSGKLDFISDRYGPTNPAKMQRHHIIALQAANKGRFASYLVQIMSILMEHAIDLGWREDNPARGIKYKLPSFTAPHVPWTAKAIAKFRENAAPLPLLIFEIGLGTAQRPGDWQKMNWEDISEGAIHVRQSKTKVDLVIPCTRELLAALPPRPKVMRIDGKTPILTGIHGRRLSQRRVAEIMLAERKRLGVAKHDLHALRYNGVMALAWAGCDDDQIMAISGHKSKQMVSKYAGIARQVMRARQASEKRDNA